MRIINVIEVNGGVIENVQSFGVFDEALVDGVVETAENYFTEKVKSKEPDVDEEDLEAGLENGYWDTTKGEYYEISIVWSEI